MKEPAKHYASMSQMNLNCLLLKNRFEALSETDEDKIKEDKVEEDEDECKDVLPDHEDSYINNNDSSSNSNDSSIDDKTQTRIAAKIQEMRKENSMSLLRSKLN